MSTLRETGQLLRLKGVKWSFRKGRLFFKNDHIYIALRLDMQGLLMSLENSLPSMKQDDVAK